MNAKARLANGFLAGLLGLSLAGLAGAADKNNYCYDNPAIGSSVKPNILLLLDNSESMNKAAYANYENCSNYDFWNCDFVDDNENYDPYTKYEGYAANDYWYKSTSSGWEIVGDCNKCDEDEPYYERSLKPDDNPNTYYSGNYLNFRLMARIDMARFVLMGGAGASRQKDTNHYQPEHADSIEPPTNDSREGVMQDVGDDARWGVATFTKKGDGGVVSTAIGKDNLTDVKSTLQTWKTVSTAQIGEALWSAAGYFAQETEASAMPGSISGSGPQYSSGDYPTGTANKDPYNYDGEYPECADSYVLLVTDGMADADENLPLDLATHEKDNLDFDLAATNSDGTENKDYGLDNVAYYLRTHDFRPEIEGDQNILTYPVYAFGDNETAREIVQNTAVNGAFRDEDGDGYPYHDDADCLLGGGDDDVNTEGTLCSEWDANFDGVPDAYFEAGGVTDLEQQLRDAVTAILQRATSGSTVAAISTQTRSGGELLQAYYLPKETVQSDSGLVSLAWKGHLRGLWTDPKGNLRDDKGANTLDGTYNKFVSSFNDQKLKPEEDRILQFRFNEGTQQVEANYLKDANGDSIPDTCAVQATETSTEVDPMFEVGEKLALREPNGDSNPRKIWFNDGSDSLVNFSVTNEGSISPYWSPEIGTTSGAESLIKFIEGYDQPNGDTSFRRRQAVNASDDAWNGVWKLGAVVTSTPRVLRQSPVNSWADLNDSYHAFYSSDRVDDRPSMVFVGSNDGMLHAFYAGEVTASSDPGTSATLKNCQNKDGVTCSETSSEPPVTEPGTEAWAFIPENALPYLRWYGDLTAQCHIPMVDYRVQLVDAAIGGSATDAQSKEDWRTLLVGMMGFGGEPIGCDLDEDGTAETTMSSSVFVMDVTDPESPELLWEKALPDNSMTLSYPSVVRRASANSNGQNGHWYLVMGSGPTEPEGESFVSDPKLYVFNLESGTTVKTLDVPDASGVAVGETVPMDPDHDDIGDAVYFGTYGAPGSTDGQLYRMNFAPLQDNWSVTKLANFSSDYSGSRPFYAAPGAALDPEDNVWIYGATGRYMSETDADTYSSPQFLFGMIDDCWGDGVDGSGNGADSNDPSNGEACTSSEDPVTVDSALVDVTNVEVKADPGQGECRCGSVKMSMGTESACTDAEGDWIIKSTGPVEYANCPSDLSCSDPDTFRDEIAEEGGWYRTLAVSPETERMFSQPFVSGGLVNALGFTPPTDICAVGGTTYQYALDYRTGTAPPLPAFLNAGGYEESDSGKGTIKGRITLGQGVPPVGEAFAAMPGGEEGELSTLTQTSTGQVTKTQTQTELLGKGILFVREPR